VSNFDDTIGDFSPTIATALLSHDAHRTAVATELAAAVRDAGFDGVQIDLESLGADDGDGLVEFAADIRSALPDSATISMAFMAEDSPAAYESAGYLFDRLQASIGRFVLMAYDEHGPTWSEAGAVGGMPWAFSAIRALDGAGLPLALVDWGVAGYGYTWPGDGTDGTQLSVAAARALAGTKARFDDEQAEWTATLADGTVVWWSDARSFDARYEAAARLGFHGLAVWELSGADPLP
jgi:spore germination protein